MADDPFDFLEPAGDASAEPAPVAPAPDAPAAPAPAQPVEGQALAPDPAGESRAIPLPTALEWRDGMKEAKRRAEALEGELKRMRDAQQQPPPTVYGDPERWQAEQDAKLNARYEDLRLRMSDNFANQRHGAEKVQAARAWGGTQFQRDPTFLARFQAQDDPVGWLVEQHGRDESLGKLGGKSFEEAAQEYLKAQGWAPPVVNGAAQPPAAQAVPLTPAPTAPPRSLASQPSAGSPANPGKITDQDMFDRAFT